MRGRRDGSRARTFAKPRSRRRAGPHGRPPRGAPSRASDRPGGGRAGRGGRTVPPGGAGRRRRRSRVGAGPQVEERVGSSAFRCLRHPVGSPQNLVPPAGTGRRAAQRGPNVPGTAAGARLRSRTATEPRLGAEPVVTGKVSGAGAKAERGRNVRRFRPGVRSRSAAGQDPSSYRAAPHAGRLEPSYADAGRTEGSHRRPRCQFGRSGQDTSKGAADARRIEMSDVVGGSRGDGRPWFIVPTVTAPRASFVRRRAEGGT